MAAVIDNRYWNGDLTTKNNTGMSDFTGIGTAISGVAGAIGTGIAASKNLKAVRETNAANLALARQQNDWNLGQWYRENAYNSPDAKLQRLQAAGLNPLFYGLDGVANANQLTSANLANQEAPQVDAGAIGSSLGHFTDSLLATQKQAWEYDIAKRQLALEDRRVSIEESLLPYNIRNTESNTNRNVQDVEESKQRINVMGAEIDKLVADKDVSEANADYIRHNTTYIDQQTALAQEMVKTEGVKRMSLKADAALKNTQSDYYKAIIEPTVEKITAEADCSKEEAKEIIQRVKNALAQEDQTKANTELIKIQTELTKKWGNAEKAAAILNSVTSSWNNFWQGTKAGVNAATDIVDHTPQGAALNAANRLSKYGSNSHINPSVNPRTGKRGVSNSTK